MDTTYRKRNIYFKVWLSLISFITGIATIITILEIYNYINTNPVSSLIIILLRGVFGLGNFISLISIWYWKKLGVFSLCFFTFLLFILNLSTEVPLALSLTGLSGVLVLLILIKFEWKYFS